VKRITVLLADDHQIVREGFRSLLGHEPDIEVVGEAATGREAVALTRKLRPAVIVMDIAMPSLNGLEATRQIRKSFPDTRVLFLSAYSDDVYVDEAITLGAAGFLLKQTSSHVLAKAIREVQKGNTFFNPPIAGRIPDPGQNPAGRKRNLNRKSSRLSLREVEVLQLIAEGVPGKKIALQLGVSLNTVDKHRQRLMSELNIHNTSGLTRHAIGEGIIEGDTRANVNLPNKRLRIASTGKTAARRQSCRLTKAA
jgi:DNA-binding NarL/FixJ family response regulator